MKPTFYDALMQNIRESSWCSTCSTMRINASSAAGFCPAVASAVNQMAEDFCRQPPPRTAEEDRKPSLQYDQIASRIHNLAMDSINRRLMRS